MDVLSISAAAGMKARLEALDFVAANRERFPFHDLVDGKYGLDRVADAIHDAAERRVLRAAIVP